VPPERAGAASGISETGAELGGALGIAVLGSIGAVVYRSEMAGVIPADAPRRAAEAGGDTLAGAVAGAVQLPAGVLVAANDAFVLGLQYAALTSAVLAAGVAVLAAILLRERRPATDEKGVPCPGEIVAVEA